MQNPDLSLILPCYNEAPVFEESVRFIRDVLDLSKLSFEVIFVDDGSSDTTRELIKKTCRSWKNSRYIFHEKNTGRGRTVIDGILSAKGDIVGYIDIDLEASPVYIPLMAKYIKSGKSDFLIGKRIYRTNSPSIIREVISVGYRSLADIMVGTGKLDTESGYKFMNRKKILPILPKTKHPHWFWDTEVVVEARRAGLKVTEMPILFIRRLDKTSSVKVIPDTIEYLKSLWGYRRRLIK